MRIFVCFVGDKTDQQDIWKTSSISWAVPFALHSRLQYPVTADLVMTGLFSASPQLLLLFFVLLHYSAAFRRQILEEALPLKSGFSQSRTLAEEHYQKGQDIKSTFFSSGKVLMLCRTAECCLSWGTKGDLER